SSWPFTHHPSLFFGSRLTTLLSPITVRRHLDAPVSSTGQAYRVRHDGTRRHSGGSRNPA
ncbi:MAG: hypothetical protein V3S76_01980, partial [Candidatus Bipolaricaulota bacterium]